MPGQNLLRLSKRALKNHFSAVVGRAVKRALSEHRKNVLAIGVVGSVARGAPGPYSDVEIFVLTRRGRPAPVLYFDEGCFVNIFFNPLKKGHAESGLGGPGDSALGFFFARSEARSTKPLYDPKGILKRRVKSLRRAKADRETVESVLWESYFDIIEYAGKLRNGWLRKDQYLVRYAARIIAEKSAEAIVALNDLSPFSGNHLWHQVLGARRKPAHFSSDYPLALAIKPTSNTGQVFSSGLRLARETLRLVKAEYGRRAKRQNFRALLSEPLEPQGL